MNKRKKWNFLALLLSFSLVFGNIAYVRAEAPSQATEVLDLSDLVYQAGGWGIGGKYLESTSQENFKSALLAALLKTEPSMDASAYGLTISEVRTLFAEVLNENPKLFYVGTTCKVSTSSGIVTKITFSYSGTPEERAALFTKIAQAASLVDDSMSDVEKALVLHDYVAQNCAYAQAEYVAGTYLKYPHLFDAYGALVEGKAVCEGYANAYRVLLSEVGIKCEMIYSDGMNHAWNAVLIDGEWYHVDVTWDDPVYDMQGRVLHTNFLLSDTAIQSTIPKHHSWNSSVTCSSTTYDSGSYWWKSVNSQIHVAAGKSYYIQNAPSKMGFQLIERSGSSTSVKYSTDSYWDIWGKYGTFYLDTYACLSSQGDYLFFNDKLNLYAMKLSDSTPQIVYTYTKGDGYIYGAMVYPDGKARLNISTTPERYTDADRIEVDLSGKVQLPDPIVVPVYTPTQDNNSETKPDTTPETKPDTTPETKPDTTPETKPDTTPETKPDTTPETKPIVVPESDPGFVAPGLGWASAGEKTFWYEDGVRQGTFDDPKGVMGDGSIRGREIYDPDSDGWYWLDSIYSGAKAVSKEVWIPYIYQNEKDFDDAEIESNAAESGDMAAQVTEAIKNGSGKWVRYDANGKMYKEWYTVEGDDAKLYPSQAGNTYYYDPKTGLMAKGKVTIGGQTYTFDEVTGALIP